MPGGSVGRSDGFQPPTLPASTPAILADRWQRLQRHYERAMDGYLPRRHSGRVTIIWAREDLEGSSTDDVRDAITARSISEKKAGPTLPWPRLAPNSEVKVVPGDHLTMLTEHAQRLAECLRSCLDQAQPRPRVGERCYRPPSPRHEQCTPA
jgi:hypothetical protein